MAIILPPDIGEAVKRHLSTGLYQTEEEVLRAALSELDSAPLDELKESLEDEAAGRFTPLEDVLSDIRKRPAFQREK